MMEGDRNVGQLLIDTHCHLNDPSFEDRMDDVLRRARTAGVAACVVPAYDRDSLKRTADLADRYPHMVFPAYGIHPWYLAGGGLSDVEAYLDDPRTVAVGEIGLDLGDGMPPADIQEEAFITQLAMAEARGLPVLVHCRKALDRLRDILSSRRPKIDVVLHSFSGSAEMMERFVGLGCHISFSGSVTRHNARKYHRCARRVPPDRFLVETDAPSIATETTVASEVEPRHSAEVAAKLAVLRSEPYDTICRVSTDNAQKVFRFSAKRSGR